MSGAIQIITAVLQLLPALITAIKALEDAIPGTGKGEAKLAVVRQIIEQVAGSATALWPFLEKVISILITTFNTVGVFKTTPAVADVPK